MPAQFQLAQDRAAWLGERLREQVAVEGVRGVVGNTYAVTIDGERIKVGEYARVLFEQERREREHVASLAERVARLGLDRGVYHRDVASWAVSAMLELARELGRTLDIERDPEAHAAGRGDVERTPARPRPGGVARRPPRAGSSRAPGAGRGGRIHSTSNGSPLSGGLPITLNAPPGRTTDGAVCRPAAAADYSTQVAARCGKGAPNAWRALQRQGRVARTDVETDRRGLRRRTPGRREKDLWLIH